MPYLRTRLLPMALAGLLAAGVGIAAQLSGKLGGAEEAAVAKRFHLRPSHPAGGLAVVAIDDATFSQLDRRWPFPRSLHAAMVQRLHAAGARAIVYDIQFSEPTTPREDLALYRALGRTGGAVLAATESDGDGHTNVLGGDANLAAVHSRAAASVLPVGRGGVVSRLPREMGGLDTLAFAAARRVSGHAPETRIPAAGARIHLPRPPRTVPP